MELSCKSGCRKDKGGIKILLFSFRFICNSETIAHGAQFHLNYDRSPFSSSFSLVFSSYFPSFFFLFLLPSSFYIFCCSTQLRFRDRVVDGNTHSFICGVALAHSLRYATIVTLPAIRIQNGRERDEDDPIPFSPRTYSVGTSSDVSSSSAGSASLFVFYYLFNVSSMHSLFLFSLARVENLSWEMKTNEWTSTKQLTVGFCVASIFSYHWLLLLCYAFHAIARKCKRRIRSLYTHGRRQLYNFHFDCVVLSLLSHYKHRPFHRNNRVEMRAEHKLLHCFCVANEKMKLQRIAPRPGGMKQAHPLLAFFSPDYGHSLSLLYGFSCTIVHSPYTAAIIGMKW